ncbi:MAG: DUF1963 domain-containing protein [Burkholderiales bacterium]|nr:DUF1963 domain-containing protein [Burkholderiales bacterium]
MIFSKLFSKNAPPPAPSQPQRDVSILAQPLAAPAVQILTQSEPSLSHFGGMPSLPAGVEWPHSNGKPLAFLARVSLGDVIRTLPIEWLPASGALLFFYDVDEQPWGIDPKDRGGWGPQLSTTSRL